MLRYIFAYKDRETIERAYVSLTQNELNMFQHFHDAAEPLRQVIVDDMIFTGAYIVRRAPW